MSRVEVPSENKLGACPTMVFGDVSTAAAAIIVMQEWWGMNQHILDTAKHISEKSGVVTLVPDIYRGKVATDRETASHYSADLDWRGAIADVDACAKYLKQQGCKKVGLTGFCQGGAMTIAVALFCDTIDAAVPFYGIPNKSGLPLDYNNLQCPLQCHFGEEDTVVGVASPEDYNPLRSKLTELNKNFEFYTYKAGHAFANSSGPNFNKEAYELSFSRMFSFFEKHLEFKSPA
ncbi:dienelactone hydrolase family protein [Plakobranchus ocellatus]|uniref:Dienelactone hydrolase family protein n=1 Tax=Plakobranchus ocellatus TaxID=259542 RepID=A0AAV4CT47_9GAST|nr:dienelactone hydrolase family protein [Plakobranchus ocellatus]